jgi:tRNA splicing ligase
MKEVNDYCDDLYESMIDQEKDKVIKTVENLKRVLNDIKKTYNDEGHIKG